MEIQRTLPNVGRLLVLTCAIGMLQVSGCCGDTGREWEVGGRVLDTETGEPIAGADVELFFWFAIDGPGNRGAPVITTDTDGRFASELRFTASCAPVLLGFFGSEATNTSGPPRNLDVTVRTQDTKTTYRFNVRRDEGVSVTYDEVAGFGVRGVIELPPVFLE